MTNTLTKELYDQWKKLQDELAHALDNRDENGVTQLNAKIQQFAHDHSIKLTEPVVRTDTIPPGPLPVDKNSDAYKSGFAHGQADLKIKEASKRYINQPGKGFDHHSVSFNAGYNDGYGSVAPPTPPPSPPSQPPSPPPSTPPSPPPAQTGDKDQFGLRKIFPDKPGGVVVTKAGVEYKTRNYSSGKPSEPTVELTITVPTANAQDIESTAIVQMTGMSHNDTIDWKHRGPAHQSGSGKKWYCIDQETSGGNKGKKLQVESPHPTMYDNSDKVTTYFSPPDISKARFGWKGITVNKGPKDVYIACWINMTPDDESGWKKVWDVHDTGQIKNGSITPATGGNVQIRIDGIIGKPTFSKASVREIVYSEASATAQ